MSNRLYKITIRREEQPAHQMAEMSATMSAEMLLATLSLAFGEADEHTVMMGEAGALHVGKFKSLTITPAP